MKILTISDSFKGTLSSSKVGQIVSEYYREKGHMTDYLPISDGGEGFLNVIQHITNQPVLSATVNNPLLKKTTAQYIFDAHNQTIYLELAETSGLTKVEETKRNAVCASTYGLGELIKYVILTHHPKKIVLGIGGSATSDVGAGMLEALGVEFFDKNHFVIHQLNNTKLMQIRKIKKYYFQKLIKGIEFITLTDVINPLNGNLGCIQVFAKQKGAEEEELYPMERNVLHFYHKTLENNKKAIDFPGAGAAGEVGYTMKYYFNSKIVSGIDTILEFVNFQEKVKEYDVIISGEGHIDSQSLNGKVISGIKKYQPKRLILITGSSTIHTNDEIYTIVPTVATLEESMKKPEESLKKLLETITI